MRSAWARGMYTLALRLLLPALFLRLWWRGRKLPAYRRRWGERLALLPELPREPRIWLHAVSVGEVHAAAPLIRRLLESGAHRVLVTTTTPTGSETLRKLFSGQVEHCYFPYDLPGVMRRFLRQLEPRLLLVMETELWPNCFRQCRERGVPVAIVNARLSEKSMRGYRKLDALTRATLSAVARIFAQDEADAQRFQRLGARPEQIEVIGNLKFHVEVADSDRAMAAELKARWSPREFIWIAASTHAGEEAQILAAHRALLETRPGALLVLAPRHPDRFDAVARLCEQSGLPFARRSRGEAVTPDTRLYLADTLGELGGLYGVADVAFVGGSLVDIGGHNPLEPAAHAIPVLSGPEVRNFERIYADMAAAEAVRLVEDEQALVVWLRRFAGDKALRRRAGEQAKAFLEGRVSGLDSVVRWVDETLTGVDETPCVA